MPPLLNKKIITQNNPPKFPANHKNQFRKLIYNAGMIILSVGMPRAGSGWYYNLTNEMILAAGGQDARQIRQRYHLQRILTEVNCNIGALTPRRVISVLVPALLGNTFVIKAHSAPTKIASPILSTGLMKTTYIYRDPRDAMLSVMENGRRAIDRGRPNVFSPYVQFDQALNFIEEYIQISLQWLELKDPLKVRYEDLLLAYDSEIIRLTAFLKLEPNSEKLKSVIDRFRPESGQSDGKGLHFSQGKIGRFRSKLDEDQQAQLNARLKPYLIRLGYAD